MCVCWGQRRGGGLEYVSSVTTQARVLVSKSKLDYRNSQTYSWSGYSEPHVSYPWLHPWLESDYPGVLSTRAQSPQRL